MTIRNSYQRSSHQRSSHSRSICPRTSHPRSKHNAVPKTNNYKKNFFVQSIKILNLSLNELKLIAKSRSIKDYKRKSEDELIKILSKLKPKIEEIGKNLMK